MKKIHVTQSFDYAVERYVTHAFSAGYVVEVDDECAAFAVARGFANYEDFAEDDLFDEVQVVPVAAKPSKKAKPEA